MKLDMLLAGMDISGDENNTNYKFLAIVIGTNENIVSLSTSIGSFPEHMSKIEKKDKESIIKKLVFDSKNRIAFCIVLDRKRIVDKIDKSRKARYRKIRKKEIYNTYERVVMQQIRKKIEPFITSHNVSMNDMIIQCDNDSLQFVKAGHFRYERKGAAYRLADYVAWCNNREQNHDSSIIDVNFTSKIPDQIKKILKLN